MIEEYEGYLIVTAVGKGSLKQIKAKGKGSVVKILRGLYTTATEARMAIDKYNTTKKEKSDGKAKSTT